MKMIECSGVRIKSTAALAGCPRCWFFSSELVKLRCMEPVIDSAGPLTRRGHTTRHCHSLVFAIVRGVRWSVRWLSEAMAK